MTTQGQGKTYLVIFATFAGAGVFEVPNEEAARDLAIALAPVYGMQSIIIGRRGATGADGMPLVIHPEKLDIGYLTEQSDSAPESMH